MCTVGSCNLRFLNMFIYVCMSIVILFYVEFQTIKPNEELYSIHNEVTNESRSIKHKGSEPVIVDYVAIDGKKLLQKASGQPLF